MKHPKEHKKEIRLRGLQGIVLVLDGLNWYLEYCWHLVCWDGGHPRKENARKGMYNTGKMVSICFLIGNITDML